MKLKITKQNKDINLINEQGNVLLNGKALGLPLGTIVSSAVVQDDSCLHALDGAAYPQNGIYAEFVTWIKSRKTANESNVPTCSNAEFESSIAQYGQCGKFVIDDENNTFRFPKVTKFIEGVSSLGEIGSAIKAGLPNITGDIRIGWLNDTAYTTLLGFDGVGAFLRKFSGFNGVYAQTTNPAVQGNQPDTIVINASNSNSIYGNSDTVQPEAVNYPYYIVVAGGVKSSAQVNLENVANDINAINSKFEAANVSTGLVRDGQHDTVVKYWVASDKLSWYREWSSGWKECGGTIPAGSNDLYTVVLPVVFSNTDYNITYTSNGDITSVNTPSYQSFIACPLTNQTAKMYRWSVPRRYYAFGY